MKNFQHGLLSEMEAEWLDQVENTQAGGAPEGPCLKQKPTLRTWPERFVRIEGKALNVYGSPAVPVRNATPSLSLCPLVCLAVLPGRLRVVSCEADWNTRTGLSLRAVVGCCPGPEGPPPRQLNRRLHGL